MRLRAVLLTTFLSIGGASIGSAADKGGTKLNLTSDGRILADAKASTLVLELKEHRRSRKPTADSECDNLNARFEDYVAGLVSVWAIVVPPGKIGGRYLIGVLSNTSTMPNDYEVCEKLYKEVWKRATSHKVASVDEVITELSPLYASRDPKYKAVLDRLPGKVEGEDDEETVFAKRYAGQVLAHLVPPLKNESVDVMALVEGYREVVAKNLYGDLFFAMGRTKVPEIFAMSPEKKLMFLSDIEPLRFKASALGNNQFGYYWNASDETFVIITDEDKQATQRASPEAYFNDRAAHLKFIKPNAEVGTFVYMKPTGGTLWGLQ